MTRAEVRDLVGSLQADAWTATGGGDRVDLPNALTSGDFAAARLQPARRRAEDGEEGEHQATSRASVSAISADGGSDFQTPGAARCPMSARARLIGS